MAYFPPQQKAIELLNKIKTVDGSGSGLDADTIDGFHANELSTVASLNDLTDVIISSPSNTQLLQYNGTNWVNVTVSLGGDHGALTGLSDDDHSQYLLVAGSRASTGIQQFTAGVRTGIVRAITGSNIEFQNASGTAVVTVDTTGRTLNIICGTGNNRDIGVASASAYDNIGQMFVYPPTGTNVKAALSVAPRGTGFAVANKAEFSVYNTDSVADTSNTEFFGMRAIGTGGYIIGTGKTGTGNDRPINFAVGWMTDGSTNSGQLFLATTGWVGISNTSPTSLLDLAASTTTRASLRIRSGVAPSSPNDGDLWFDGTNFKCRISGVTKTFTVV